MNLQETEDFIASRCRRAMEAFIGMSVNDITAAVARSQLDDILRQAIYHGAPAILSEFIWDINVSGGTMRVKMVPNTDDAYWWLKEVWQANLVRLSRLSSPEQKKGE